MEDGKPSILSQLFLLVFRWVGVLQTTCYRVKCTVEEAVATATGSRIKMKRPDEQMRREMQEERKKKPLVR